MMKNSYFILVISALLALPITAFAEVKAYLNQNSFFDGDPVTLKIETTEKNSATPDLSPLQKDFSVLGTSTSSQVNIMNGRRTFMKSWTIELQPKNKGALLIPSISIGKNKTKTLKLSIADLPPEVTAETNKHIFIEESVGIASNKTFVQQQIPYTVKLFYDATMQTAQIFTPTLENAIIEKLGADQRYKVIRAGKRFNVVEKRYVISPEKSGALHIPPSTVKGRIALSGGDSQKLRRRMDETDMLNNFYNDFRDDPFFKDAFGGGFFSSRSRGPSKPFTVSGNPIEVNVLPVPKAFTGSSWLPAEDLIIKDSWAKKPPELKEGEPVTRTLTLQAKGLAGSQIPDIIIPKPEKLKSYPEKAKTDTQTDGNTVYGIQQIEISYIPSTNGKVSIPEIKVDWWDVKNKKQKTFTVPAWNLSVAADLTKATADNAPLTDVKTQTIVDKNSTVDNPSILPSTEDNTPNKYWGWKFIIAVPALLILLGIGFYRVLISRKASPKNSTKSVVSSSPRKKTVDINALRSSLLQACANNDKQGSAGLLVKYAQAYWGDDSIQSLGLLSSKLSKGSAVVKRLEQSLYSENIQKWQGDDLGELVESGLNKEQKFTAQNNDGLAPLYPNISTSA